MGGRRRGEDDGNNNVPGHVTALAWKGLFLVLGKYET